MLASKDRSLLAISYGTPNANLILPNKRIKTGKREFSLIRMRP